MSHSATTTLVELLGKDFLVRLDSLDVLSRKLFQGKMQGERHSKRRGQSVEFADHRPYSAGDDLRFIDWNIFARLEQLFLKLLVEEQDLTIHVLMDCSASIDTGEPSKLLAMKKLAAALCYISLVNNNRVTLSLFADGLTWQMANLRGRAQMHQLAEGLLKCPAEGSTDFEKACRQLKATRSGWGVVIVLSDFLFKAGYQEGLKRLLSRRYDLYAIQVLSPQELEPSMAGDLQLVDMEDGDVAEVTISFELLKRYKHNLACWCAELRQFCTRRGATYVMAHSAQPTERLVVDYFQRIGLLR